MLHSGSPLHLFDDLPVLPDGYRLALGTSHLLVVTSHSEQHLLLFVGRSVVELVQTISARFHSMHYLRIGYTGRNLLLLARLLVTPLSTLGRRRNIHILLLYHF